MHLTSRWIPGRGDTSTATITDVAGREDTGKWDALAAIWGSLSPPASPSSMDVTAYRSAVRLAFSRVEQRTAVLMGSTPVLRALLSEESDRYLVIDHSAEMYAQSTSILGRVPANEDFIQQDWTEDWQMDGRVAAAIGDKVLDNIDFANWPSLIGQLASSLEPQGVIAVRVADAGATRPSTMARTWQFWLDSARAQSCTYSEACSGIWESSLSASTTTLPGVQSTDDAEAELDTIDIEDAPDSRQLHLQLRAMFEASRGSRWTAYRIGHAVRAFEDGDFCLACSYFASDYTEGHRQPVLSFVKNSETIGTYLVSGGSA